MKRIAIGIVTVILLVSSLSCSDNKGNNPQNRGTWQITIGGEEYDDGYGIVAVDAGDYIVAGQTSSQGSGSYDMYLLRIDSSGSVLWEKTFGGAGNDNARAVTTSSDGGILSLGQWTSTFPDFYLVKISGAGAVQWDHTYGGPGLDDARSIAADPQGGYFLAGSSIVSLSESPYVVKIDDAGAAIWESEFSSSSGGSATAVVPDGDGGCIVAGSALLANRRSNIVVWELDASGNEVSSRSYGGGAVDMCNAALRLPDQGLLLVGFTTSSGSGGQDAYVLRLDTAGNEVWSKTYGGAESDGAHAVAATPDGNFVLVGWTNSMGAGNSDVYLVKIDIDGSLIWQRTFGGAAEDRGRAVAVADNGGLVIAGSTRSLGAGRSDVYVIKTNADGEL